MPPGEELRFAGVTKRFGAVTAVDDLTATVRPGAVTGFLGPNGAGKTTTLRILLGLVAATSGTATVGGVAYRDLKQPLRTVGAALEASSFHPGRSARGHLRVYARAAELPDSRVDEVLEVVGLTDAADRKVGGYSLGMRQRLGLAFALLGDPGVLVLDEPVNGLDPEGIRWMRGLLQSLAGEGRTVLVSSHLLSEVQQTADALLVIARGRLVFEGGIGDLVNPDEERTIFDGPDRAALTAAMRAAGIEVEVLRSGLTARQADPVDVGRAAAAAGAVLSSLVRRGPSLEEAFLGLVDGTRAPRAVLPDVESGRAEPGGVLPELAPAAVPPAQPLRARSRRRADEPDGPTRSFAVAATGVIDVVPGAQVAARREAPDAETAQPVAAVPVAWSLSSEAAAAGGLEGTDGSEPEPEPGSEPESEPAPEDSSAITPAPTDAEPPEQPEEPADTADEPEERIEADEPEQPEPDPDPEPEPESDPEPEDPSATTPAPTDAEPPEQPEEPADTADEPEERIEADEPEPETEPDPEEPEPGPEPEPAPEDSSATTPAPTDSEPPEQPEEPADTADEPDERTEPEDVEVVEAELVEAELVEEDPEDLVDDDETTEVVLDEDGEEIAEILPPDQADEGIGGLDDLEALLNAGDDDDVDDEVALDEASAPRSARSATGEPDDGGTR